MQLTASSSWFRARKRSLWLEMMESSESTWPSGRAPLAGADGPRRWRGTVGSQVDSPSPEGALAKGHEVQGTGV